MTSMWCPTKRQVLRVETCVNDYVEATSKGRSVPCKQCEHGAAVRDCYAAGLPLPKHLRTTTSDAKAARRIQTGEVTLRFHNAESEMVSAGQSVPHPARADAKRRDEMRARLQILAASGRLDGHRGRRVEAAELARREELAKRFDAKLKSLPVSMAMVTEVAGLRPKLVVRRKNGPVSCTSQNLELLIQAAEVISEELAARKRK